jgi:hypothetical protein
MRAARSLLIYVSVGWASPASAQRDAYRGKTINLMLFTIGLARSPKAPDSPSAVELAPDARAKNIMRLAASASEIGRSFLAPPGTAPARVVILRQAFAHMLQDAGWTAGTSRCAMTGRSAP